MATKLDMATKLIKPETVSLPILTHYINRVTNIGSQYVKSVVKIVTNIILLFLWIPKTF